MACCPFTYHEGERIKMNECILCVDAGGTKTEVVAYTLDGKTITTHFGGSGNFAFEPDLAIENVFQTLKTVYDQISDRYQIRLILMGISGYGAVADKEGFLFRFRSAFRTDVHAVDDAKLALYTLVKENLQEAVLVLAGTGSACYGMKGDKTLLIGGWGHLLGDEGSAHHVVLETFRLMIRDEDEGRPPRPLSKAFLNHLGLTSTFDVKKVVYSWTKSQLAALAPFLVEQAEAGDPDAQRLLKASGEALGKHVILAFQRLHLSPNAVIGCQGSFIRNVPMVKQAMIETVHRIYPKAQLVEIEERPIRGAYYLARRMLRRGERI